MDSQNPPSSSHGQTGQRAQPVYDTHHGGHYGASATLAAQGYAPIAEFYTGTWANVNQGLHGTYKEILTTYWQHIISHLESETHDYKLHQLPLARIKKVMKADPDVKMISAEAPILFAKGCDIFITELTMRAWIHAEENKRRTLQRSDIASALAKSDMFDFLIDIVPREEAASHAKRAAGGAPAPAPGAPPGGSQIPPQQMPQATHPAQPQLPHQPYMAPGMPEHEYPQQQPMYASQVQPNPAAQYGAPQPPMYNDMEVYGYPNLPQQQPLYQVPQQRTHDPSISHDQGHNYPRNDGGDADADAEGERDYEVG